MDEMLGTVEGWIWGAPLLVLLLVAGLYLTVVLRGIQFRCLWQSLKLSLARQEEGAEGDITQFQALMTALAGMIGIGSITGVATALTLGGLGSLFWMWVASLIGMATKYAEAILAVRYRGVNEKGEMAGGPMYYLAQGLGMKKLALFFALMGAGAALGTGNMVQANSVAAALTQTMGIDPLVTGLLLAAISAYVLLGGIRTIGKISSWLVPTMALLYIGGGLIVLALRIEAVPGALLAIFKAALDPQAFLGGSAGLALQYGVSRSVFSSEAGLGTAPIAAAAAKTDSPSTQALISMSSVFLTSIVVCSITGLVIAVSGLLEGPLTGSQLALAAFEQALPGGGLIVSISLILFAYSTILGWAYYGEQCVAYLFGAKAIRPYRYLYIAAIIPGAALSLQTVWSLANIMNGLMAFPNLIGICGLAGVVVAETRRSEASIYLTK